MAQNNQDRIFSYYSPDRPQHTFVDKQQLSKDQLRYNYACADGLYLVSVSEDNTILGVIFLNNWANKRPLFPQNGSSLVINELSFVASSAFLALENLSIHQKIENLLSDKQELKARIQKDEEDLKRRVLELSVLYDISNSLGGSLDYYQTVSLAMDALNKVFHYDICSILLLDFHPNGEIITRANEPFEESLFKSVHSNLIAATTPFIREPVSLETIEISIQKASEQTALFSQVDRLKSLANVPLIFKEEVIGMLALCSTLKDAFSHSELTFLHTIANQLTSHLGRLKLVQNMQKSKINSLIKSMSDAIIFLDAHHHPEIINPAAHSLLGLAALPAITCETILTHFREMHLHHFYDDVFRTKAPIYNKEIIVQDKILLMTILPVTDTAGEHIGTVLDFSDVSELQRIHRIKAQRLDAISGVNTIISTISDLSSLVPLLLQFILNTANATIGAIQLYDGKGFHTKVHANFPDKIRRSCCFTSGESISDFVIRTKELCFVDNYAENSRVHSGAKILLEALVCIPIMVNAELIGIVTIVKKAADSSQQLTNDDIETLATITSLSGTALHNAILYQKNLDRQKWDQELKVASKIQMHLLPKNIPEIDKIELGTLSIPARAMGGDYYDFFQLSNNKVGIIVADIVGKGISAGMFMAVLKSIFNSNIRKFTSPKKALSLINKLLFKDPVINKFTPVFYAVFDPKTHSLTYCNAGHEPAILFTKGQVVSLDTNGFPLGAYHDTVYEEKQLNLFDQDVVLLYTDGIVEAKNLSGKAFGTQKINSVVKKHLKKDPSNLVNYLHQECLSHLDTAEQFDDLTVIALKVNHEKETAKQGLIQVKQVSVSSSTDNIKKIRQIVEQIGDKMGFADTEIYNLKLAINEAHANIIEHTYLGHDKGDILFKFYSYQDRLEITIKDFGSRERQKSLTQGRNLDELEGSGLGEFLINNVMDDVVYTENLNVGSELKLTKYIN